MFCFYEYSFGEKKKLPLHTAVKTSARKLIDRVRLMGWGSLNVFYLSLLPLNHPFGAVSRHRHHHKHIDRRKAKQKKTRHCDSTKKTSEEKKSVQSN